MVLCGIIAFFKRGSVSQTVGVIFVSLFFCVAHFRAQPFATPMLNAVKTFSEFLIFGVLTMCVVQQTDSTMDFNLEEVVTMSGTDVCR